MTGTSTPFADSLLAWFDVHGRHHRGLQICRKQLEYQQRTDEPEYRRRNSAHTSFLPNCGSPAAGMMEGPAEEEQQA
jgi:hypothetical protein